MASTDPRARLLQLASDQGVSLSGLSEMIGRNSTYLQQFIRKGSPRKLEETDRRTLARFFGVEEAELGAPEDFSPRRPRRGPRAANGSMCRVCRWGLRPGRARWPSMRLRSALFVFLGTGCASKGSIPRSSPRSGSRVI